MMEVVTIQIVSGLRQQKVGTAAHDALGRRYGVR